MLKEQCNVIRSRGLKTGVMGEENLLQGVLEGSMKPRTST